MAYPGVKWIAVTVSIGPALALAQSPRLILQMDAREPAPAFPHFFSALSTKGEIILGSESSSPHPLPFPTTVPFLLFASSRLQGGDSYGSGIVTLTGKRLLVKRRSEFLLLRSNDEASKTFMKRDMALDAWSLSNEGTTLAAAWGDNRIELKLLDSTATRTFVPSWLDPHE